MVVVFLLNWTSCRTHQLQEQEHVRPDATAYLFIQGDVHREAEGVFELDFVREELADLFGGGR